MEAVKLNYLPLSGSFTIHVGCYFCDRFVNAGGMPSCETGVCIHSDETTWASTRTAGLRSSTCIATAQVDKILLEYVEVLLSGSLKVAMESKLKDVLFPFLAS